MENAFIFEELHYVFNSEFPNIYFLVLAIYSSAVGKLRPLVTYMLPLKIKYLDTLAFIFYFLINERIINMAHIFYSGIIKCIIMKAMKNV